MGRGAWEWQIGFIFKIALFLPVGATPPNSLYKTPSPLLNILGVQKLLLYTTPVAKYNSVSLCPALPFHGGVSQYTPVYLQIHTSWGGSLIEPLHWLLTPLPLLSCANPQSQASESLPWPFVLPLSQFKSIWGPLMPRTVSPSIFNLRVAQKPPLQSDNNILIVR